jgi:hypothetical protein
MDRLVQVQFPSSDRSLGVNNSSTKIKITRPTNPVQVLVPSPAVQRRWESDEWTKQAAATDGFRAYRHPSGGAHCSVGLIL